MFCSDGIQHDNNVNLSIVVNGCSNIYSVEGNNDNGNFLFVRNHKASTQFERINRKNQQIQGGHNVFKIFIRIDLQ